MGMIPDLDLRCPLCGQLLEILSDDEWSGKSGEIRCLGCSTRWSLDGDNGTPPYGPSPDMM